MKALSARGRVLQDLRAVFAEQRLWTGHQTGTNVFRPRLMYRNVTDLGKGLRFSGTVTGETEFAPRPSLRYDPPATPSTFVVNTLLVHYRASKTLEFAAGRDQLPTGINIPDLAVFIKARARYGYYDSPAQIKAFWGDERYQVTPFVYAPGGTANGDRRMVGVYTRLGFGQWGILAEHHVTDRARDSPAAIAGSFRQQASYAQVFWAVREWLVASAIGERLRVEQPFVERLDAGKLELAGRLTNHVAIGISARAQRNQLTGISGKSVALQVALKTAQ